MYYIPKILQNAAFTLIIFLQKLRQKIRNSGGYDSLFLKNFAKKSSRLTYGILKYSGDMLALMMLPIWHNRYKIWYWKKQLGLNQHLQVLNIISADLNGFHLSQRARLHNDALAYVYGEIDATAFIALLSLCHLGHDSVFYDLGSGTGKTVLLCGMIFSIKKSCGIELLAPLHQAALLQRQRLSEYPEYTNKALHISYIQDDFLIADFSDATVLYINATAFFGDIWVKLNHKFDQLIHCCTIITTTKPLIAASYQLIHKTRVQMSWGVVQAFIHTRMNGI